MSQSITIKIDKRLVTLTAADIEDLVDIAGEIRYSESVCRYEHHVTGWAVISRHHIDDLNKWMDTHGPEGSNQ